MTDDVVATFHSTAALTRSAIFVEDALQPITAIEDGSTAAPGWVGAAWQTGGTLLVGINPGGGGDAYRRNPNDAKLYRLIRAFRDGAPEVRAAALAAMSEAWINIQATHNIRRVIDAVLDAVGADARSSAFINVVPFRTRNDAPPRRADLARAWAVASSGQVEALSPGRIVALGRKAYDALVQVGADRKLDVVLIKRSIGDSTITPEAREVLATLRGDRKGLPAPRGLEERSVANLAVPAQATAARPIAPAGSTATPAAPPADHPLTSQPGIKSPAAPAAHLHLLDTAARMNLSPEPHASAITAVKLLDRQRRYLFSWIINAHHLLFYVRKPALKIAPGLAKGAQRSLSGVKVNPAGEVTVRLETVADAERLTAWLFDRATWTSSSRLDDARPASGALAAPGGD